MPENEIPLTVLVEATQVPTLATLTSMVILLEEFKAKLFLKVPAETTLEHVLADVIKEKTAVESEVFDPSGLLNSFWQDKRLTESITINKKLVNKSVFIKVSLIRRRKISKHLVKSNDSRCHDLYEKLKDDSIQSDLKYLFIMWINYYSRMLSVL